MNDIFDNFWALMVIYVENNKKEIGRNWNNYSRKNILILISERNYSHYSHFFPKTKKQEM